MCRKIDGGVEDRHEFGHAIAHLGRAVELRDVGEAVHVEITGQRPVQLR